MKRGILKFGDFPADNVPSDRVLDKSLPEINDQQNKISWDKTGALYWLGHDLMWAVDALLRGGKRKDIIHGLNQSLLNLQEVGFSGSYMDAQLIRIRDEALESEEKDWHRVRRNYTSIVLLNIINDIGKIAAANQPGFKQKLDSS